MKHIKHFNEGLATGFGALLAKISTGTNNLLGRIGKTGNDEDIADEILKFLNKMNTDYNKSTKLDKTKVSKVGDMENYVFFGSEVEMLSTKFSNNYQQEYRVDVIKAMSKEFFDDPYRIIISKIVEASRGRFIGFDGTKNAGKQPMILSTPNPEDDEKMAQLDCSQQIAKKIYDKTKEIYDKTNKNTIGDARGGENSLTKKPGKLGNWTW